MNSNFLTSTHIVAYLAYTGENGKLTTSEQIADTMKINPAVVRRLRRAGLVAAVRGKTGGYALSRPATAITLLDVFTATEGENPDFFALANRDNRPGCSPIANSIQRTLGTLLSQSLDELKRNLGGHSIAAVLGESLDRLGIARCQ